MPLRLSWTRTWPDKPEDFSCSHDGKPVGRIHSDEAPRGEGKRWAWSLNGYLPEHNVWLNRSGIEPTKQAAAEALEHAYFEAKDRTANGQ